MSNTFTVHHEAILTCNTEARSEDRCTAKLSMKRSSFPDSDQFINSISRESIKVTPKSVRRLTASGKVIVLADCLHLVDWCGTGALGNTSTLGSNFPWAQQAWICFFLCKPYTSSSRQQTQTLNDPRHPSSPRALL